VKEGKLKEVTAVDTGLIVNVKARLPNSRGVMEDWREDSKERRLNVS
jgi:hypothetical protein